MAATRSRRQLPSVRAAGQRAGAAAARAALLLASAGLLGWAISGAFLGAPRKLRRLPSGRPTGWPQPRVAALPWDTEGNARSERAYATWAAAYPTVATRNFHLGNPCDKATVERRFEDLSELVGPEVALEAVEKEPKVLLWRPEAVRAAWERLKSLEEPGQEITAMSVIRKNPSLFTCDAYAFKGKSLESFDQSATVVDALRPLGEIGTFIVFNSAFVFLLVFLRLTQKALQPVLDAVLAALPRPF